MGRFKTLRGGGRVTPSQKSSRRRCTITSTYGTHSRTAAAPRESFEPSSHRLPSFVLSAYPFARLRSSQMQEPVGRVPDPRVGGKFRRRVVSVLPIRASVALPRRVRGVPAVRHEQISNLLAQDFLHARQHAAVPLREGDVSRRRDAVRRRRGRQPVLRSGQGSPRVRLLQAVLASPVHAARAHALVLGLLAVRVPHVRDEGLPEGVPARHVERHRAGHLESVVEVGVVPAVRCRRSS